MAIWTNTLTGRHDQRTAIERQYGQGGRREALEKAVENDEYIKPDIPHKHLQKECGQAKVTASAAEAIYDWKSR